MPSDWEGFVCGSWRHQQEILIPTSTADQCGGYMLMLNIAGYCFSWTSFHSSPTHLPHVKMQVCAPRLFSNTANDFTHQNGEKASVQTHTQQHFFFFFFWCFSWGKENGQRRTSFTESKSLWAKSGMSPRVINPGLCCCHPIYVFMCCSFWGCLPPPPPQKHRLLASRLKIGFPYDGKWTKVVEGRMENESAFRFSSGGQCDLEKIRLGPEIKKRWHWRMMEQMEREVLFFSCW